MKFWIVIGCFLSYALAKAQSQPNTLDFKLLRQKDSIFIPEPRNFYQNIKKLHLSNNSSLSFGGSHRIQAETFLNEQFSTENDQNDIWFLNRFQLHSHLKVSDKFEAFAELNSSLVSSKEEISPVDKDALSINQLFARYYFSNWWNILAGRQNIRFGSGRLIDIREGPNVRLSFDMAQLQYINSETQITGFYAVPVQLEEGVFDNSVLNLTESVAALYWTQNWNSNTNTDIYTIYKEEENKTWDSGTADENRLSIGLRHFGTWKEFIYNNEFIYQTGSFGEQNINAWTASFNIEYSLPLLGTDAIIGLKTEAISGDKSNNDTTLNTFDGLYPRGAYFGRVARFGPSNLLDIHPYINATLKNFYFSVDYVAFWRLSVDDGIYGPPLNLVYPDTNNKNFIAHQLGTINGYDVNRSINFEFETNLIFPDDFLNANDLDNVLFHAVLTAEIKF